MIFEVISIWGWFCEFYFFLLTLFAVISWVTPQSFLTISFEAYERIKQVVMGVVNKILGAIFLFSLGLLMQNPPKIHPSLFWMDNSEILPSLLFLMNNSGILPRLPEIPGVLRCQISKILERLECCALVNIQISGAAAWLQLISCSFYRHPNYCVLLMNLDWDSLTMQFTWTFSDHPPFMTKHLVAVILTTTELMIF